MRRTTALTSLGCFVLTLTFTSTAAPSWAAGGWRLWSQDIMGSGWVAHATRGTRTDCLTEMAQKVDESAGVYYGEPGYLVRTNSSSVLATKRDGTAVMAIAFECLPDTVDPRVPKTK